MKPVGLSKDQLSSNFVNWNYRIPNKELHQITETTWIAYVTGRESNDIMKMLPIHTTSNKRLRSPLNTRKNDNSF